MLRHGKLTGRVGCLVACLARVAGRMPWQPPDEYAEDGDGGHSVRGDGQRRLHAERLCQANRPVVQPRYVQVEETDGRSNGVACTVAAVTEKGGDRDHNPPQVMTPGDGGYKRR